MKKLVVFRFCNSMKWQGIHDEIIVYVCVPVYQCVLLMLIKIFIIISI